MASMGKSQNAIESSSSSMTGTEHPPRYQEYQPPEDFYAPRARDFQPPTPEIAAKGSGSSSSSDSDAESLLPSYDAVSGQNRWGRYRTEEAYLAALRAFVETKDYVDGGVDGHGNSVGLIGFYGTKTGADYANQPGPWDDTKKHRKRREYSERHDAYAGFLSSTEDGKVKAGFWQRVRRDRTDMR